MDNNQAIRRKMIMALYEIPGIGWHAISKAVNRQLWRKPNWTVEDLLDVELRRDQAQSAAKRFEHRSWMETEEPSPAVTKAGAMALTPYDDAYPPILREIAQPPWVLYMRGRLELLQRQAIAIVGTRVPTAYGRHTASIMAEELSNAGVAVVSGLARGVDRRAHEAALRGAGGTIAVLPTPIDACYPSENESLYRRIGEEGLLVSETPIGTKLHPGQFHQRNRVIAALSRATIVVEGAEKSGSLITARHAMNMNREVFAVPGPITSPKSEGPNKLIRTNGAKLISSIQQIFDELGWLRGIVEKDRMLTNQPAPGRHHDEYQITPDENKLIALLQDQPLSINELHELSAIPFGHLNALLLNLCLKRKIELQPGSVYIAL